MELQFNRNTVLVTDLDDTLCYEADFVLSGLNAAARILTVDTQSESIRQLQQGFSFGMPPFDYLFRKLPQLSVYKEKMLEEYRTHLPELKFRRGAAEFLQLAKKYCHAVILITDGRAISQRNKLKALGIENSFDHLFISEERGFDKKEPHAYQFLISQYPNCDFIYIGDNPVKDFIRPQEYGWKCIGLLNDGRHIHPQDPELIKKAARVTFVRSFSDLTIQHEK